jgi:hypothetical protein
VMSFAVATGIGFSHRQGVPNHSVDRADLA